MWSHDVKDVDDTALAEQVNEDLSKAFHACLVDDIGDYVCGVCALDPSEDEGCIEELVEGKLQWMCT